MDILLRAASKSDLEFLYRLHQAAMHAYVVKTWGEWDEAWQHKYFAEHFDPDHCEIIVADFKDIGVISVIRAETEIFLKYVELFPEYQRQGIGTKLLQSLCAEAKRKALPLTLQVLKVNPARGLYERLGFLITGETGTHYRMVRKP